MKFGKKLCVTMAFTLAMCFSAVAADMNVEFTLTSEAQLGSSVLPAGKYMGVVSSSPTPMMQVWAADNSSVAIALAFVDDSQVCSASAMKIINEEGMSMLSSICVKGTGTSLTFVNAPAKVGLLKSVESASIR